MVSGRVAAHVPPPSRLSYYNSFGLEGGGPVHDIPGPAQGVCRLGQVQVPVDIGGVRRGNPDPGGYYRHTGGEWLWSQGQAVTTGRRSRERVE